MWVLSVCSLPVLGQPNQQKTKGLAAFGSEYAFSHFGLSTKHFHWKSSRT